jgi:hypothetical protein
MIVEVYATEDGGHLGTATYEKDVLFSTVVKPDPEDPHLTALLASDETTECLVMSDKTVIFGFECYFKPVYMN